MTSEKTVRTLCEFADKYSNYRHYNAERGEVEKIWNRGMGCLVLFKVYEDERAIVYNTSLFNRQDERKLEDLEYVLGGKWERVPCHFGYPLFYNHSMSLKMAREQANEGKTK